MSGGDELAYYTANADGEPNVTALSATDGTVAWTADLGAAVTGRVVAADAVAVVPTDDGLQCLDPADGSVRWSLAVDVAGRVAVVDDLLYATVGGTVRAYRAP